MQKRTLWWVMCLCLNIQAQYIYEANQDLYQLQKNANNFEGELAYEIGDDQLSTTINLPFTFTFYNQQFDSVRLAMNGCVHFGLGTGNINANNYCADYTPDPLTTKNYTYTMFPFWTDLIRDNNSRVKSWGDNTKMILGFYDVREYNRASDNSFEVILYPNNTFEYRYDELDIINHDVLIGEIGANSNESYTYLFHDECNTGTTNSSDCVSQNWNNSTFNTTLEGGGSLYGVGSGNAIDCSDPLNNINCAGYADALLSQQCNITQLYSQSCPNYYEALQDQDCEDDPQSSPVCIGYTQPHTHIAHSQIDFGFFDEQEQYATGIFIDQHHDQQHDHRVEIIEVFEDDFFEIFDDEHSGHHDDFFTDEFYDEEIVFFDPEPLPFINERFDRGESFLPEEDIIFEQFVLQETLFVEDYSEPETILVFNTIQDLDEWFEEELEERNNRSERNENDEDRLVRSEIDEETGEQEIFREEIIEEIFEEIEEAVDEEVFAELEDEILEEELLDEEFSVSKSPTKSSSKMKKIALNAINKSLRISSASISAGSGSGGSSNNFGNSVSNQAQNQSGSTLSVSSSPSISDQISSSVAQTNQVLQTFDTGSTVNVSVAPLPDVDGAASMSAVDVQVSSVQGEIENAASGVVSASEADQIADQIIANNIEQQKEQLEEEQNQTGEYGDESTLVALIGFVPNFQQYSAAILPDQQSWYASQDIYSNATLDDNINAFYEYAGTNIRNLEGMIDSQPEIWR